MARVELRHLSKSYPGVAALADVDVTIESGEFFTLLGPSGCGKTTLLRTVAGFNRQDNGEVWVAGTRIDDVPAYRRNIGLVFQDYAIFPHMSVGDNVAFGLRNRRRPSDEIAQRVARALDLVRLSGFASRLPHQLSGGQQQRVGLARAVVIEPQILLMDEPLSNLDAKLRIELRDDIRDLQRSLGITTIYVTHDQDEALVMSDRICVMQAGRVHQVGTPWDVYARPATLFVASFVGAMNVIAGVPSALSGGRVTLAIRLEDMIVADATEDAPPDAMALDGVVDKVTFAGREAFYRVRLDDGPQVLAHVHRPERQSLQQVGARVRLVLPRSRLHFFDPGTGHRIEATA
jgi:ABC-type Fe3+/spermidine/putrescine transport system ATPase subunit